MGRSARCVTRGAGTRASTWAPVCSRTRDSGALRRCCCSAAKPRVATQTGLIQNLGSLGGLLTCAALPLLTIPLIKRRRELKGLRAQLRDTARLEAELTAATAHATGGSPYKQNHGLAPRRVFLRGRPSQRCRSHSSTPPQPMDPPAASRGKSALAESKLPESGTSVSPVHQACGSSTPQGRGRKRRGSPGCSTRDRRRSPRSTRLHKPQRDRPRRSSP